VSLFSGELDTRKIVCCTSFLCSVSSYLVVQSIQCKEHFNMATFARCKQLVKSAIVMTLTEQGLALFLLLIRSCLNTVGCACGYCPCDGHNYQTLTSCYRSPITAEGVPTPTLWNFILKVVGQIYHLSPVNNTLTWQWGSNNGVIWYADSTIHMAGQESCTMTCKYDQFSTKSCSVPLKWYCILQTLYNETKLLGLKLNFNASDPIC
jgi:hypothetical protein